MLNRFRFPPFLVLVFIGAVGVCWPASAMAESISVESSIVSTIAETDLIVRGEVIDAKARWLPDHSAIVTDSRVRPIYSVMGDVTQPISVTVPGGVIEDDNIAMVQSRVRPLQPGQQVILFLRDVDPTDVNLADVDRNYRLTTGASSHIVIDGDTARNTASGSEQSLDQLYADVEQIVVASGKSFVLPPDWQAYESAVSAANVLVPVDFIDTGRRWPGDNPIVDYYVNINTEQAGSLDGSVAEFRTNIEHAGFTWSRVDTASIALRLLGSTDATATGFNERNEILFSSTLSENVLGQARVWFNPRNNIIAEVDMAINNNHDFDATGAPDSHEVDLQSVVLHEMGHWLSLGHDDEQQSVMVPALTTGTKKRELHASDVEGVSTIYPCQSISCIRDWVPMPIPLPDPMPTPLPDEQPDKTQVTVKPDEETAHIFGDNNEAINVELAIPANAVSQPTTIDYEAVETLPVPPDSDHLFSGYSFALNASQQGQDVADFSFNRSVVLEVHYDDAGMSADEERRLVLQALDAGQWQAAGCGSPVHSPQADQIAVPICELSQFALFVEVEDVAPSLLTNQVYVPAVWR